MSRPFILIGNYGAGNIGDDALAEYFLKTVQSENVLMVRATRVPSSLPRLPFGFRSFLRPWWRTIIAIARSRGIIYGGGTLFTDTESISACVMWWMYAGVAHIFSKPIYLAFQGVGPFRTRLGEWIARRVFQTATYISVRDEPSLARVRAWNLRSAPVLTFDPAFVRFLESQTQNSTERVLTLIPRHNSGESFLLASLQALEESSWDHVQIVLMDPSVTERAFAERLRALPLAEQAQVLPVRSVTEFLDVVSTSTLVVAERFHGLLAATALRIPFRLISTNPGDKFSTLARYSDPKNSDPTALLDLVKAGERSLLHALHSSE